MVLLMSFQCYSNVVLVFLLLILFLILFLINVIFNVIVILIIGDYYEMIVMYVCIFHGGLYRQRQINSFKPITDIKNHLRKRLKKTIKKND